MAHGRPRPCPLPPLLRRAEQWRQAEGEHGGNENLQTIPTCDHISKWLPWLQHTFGKTTRDDDSVCRAHVLSVGVNFLCFPRGTTAAPERPHVKGAKFLLRCNEGVFFPPYTDELITSFGSMLFICSLKGVREAQCGFAAWRDVPYLVEEHPGRWTCHQHRELCFYLTSHRSSSRPGRHRHFGWSGYTATHCSQFTSLHYCL